VIRELVDEVVTVSDDDIARALLVLLERAKQVVEPAGAVGVAAILAGKITASGRTAVILSGATSTRSCCSASWRTDWRHPAAT
jgi:threonine dehydratase